MSSRKKNNLLYWSICRIFRRISLQITKIRFVLIDTNNYHNGGKKREMNDMRDDEKLLLCNDCNRRGECWSLEQKENDGSKNIIEIRTRKQTRIDDSFFFFFVLQTSLWSIKFERIENHNWKLEMFENVAQIASL